MTFDFEERFDKRKFYKKAELRMNYDLHLQDLKRVKRTEAAKKGWNTRKNRQTSREFKKIFEDASCCKNCVSINLFKE
jgi:hypothetical protein